MSECEKREVRELAPKPSDAIKAMIAGLRGIPSDSFVVVMSSFGGTGYINGRNVCFGCAATCAAHKLAGKQPSCKHITDEQQRAEYLDFDPQDLMDFEIAIDDFRQGWLGELLEDYYGLDRQKLPDELTADQPWDLHSNNWQEQLPAIEAYVAELEAAGF
jgi:hypothetical protein